MFDPPRGTQRRQTRKLEFRETVCKIIRDQGYTEFNVKGDAGRVCLKCIHNVLITFGHGGWNIYALYSCDQYQHLCPPFAAVRQHPFPRSRWITRAQCVQCSIIPR